MAEISNELMYELLKKLNARTDKVDLSLGEIRSEMNSIRGAMVSMHQEIHNIYSTLSRHEMRLDRIETRLEL
jgi:predicted  nucleic acid-binding Zn-ribbon protein